jgi:hypothetical protein
MQVYTGMVNWDVAFINVLTDQCNLIIKFCSFLGKFYTFRKIMNFIINFPCATPGVYWNGKLRCCLLFKCNFGFENYLSIVRSFEHRKNITKLRISAHKLQIEVGRYQGILLQNRVCHRCSTGEIDDEIHYREFNDSVQSPRINFAYIIFALTKRVTSLWPIVERDLP